MIAVILAVSLAANILALALLIIQFKKQAPPDSESPKHEAADVEKFYDAQTGNFLQVYGQVIQAFRTRDVSILLNYQAGIMELKPGLNVLDAGCGVCGPAVYFAQHHQVQIEAITISGVQKELAEKNIQEKKMENLVRVKQGDFHQLDKIYPAGNFDVVYFLESFGHAHHHEEVLNAAWQTLKPGGLLYIKDLFRKKTSIKAIETGIEKEILNINRAYRYNVPELNDILDLARKKGFILTLLKTIDIPLEEFENLSISNQFQELTGINKINNLREYIFPVDFFELKLMKPAYNTAAGNSRYFLQNMYFLQVENWKENEL